MVGYVSRVTAAHSPESQAAKLFGISSEFPNIRHSKPSQRPKIAIVTDAWKPQINGVVTTVHNLKIQLKQLGYRAYVVTPDNFNSIPSMYPQVRLAIPIGMERYLTQIAPDHVLIMTEGPLGWAVRHFCIKYQRPFTTCYTTRWPEYMESLYKFPPKDWGYEYVRRFHEGAQATLVSTPSLLAELSEKGFNNLALWNRGVDLSQFKLAPNEEKANFLPELPRPFYLYVGRISKEKNIEAFLNLEIPGSKILVGQGPDFDELQRLYPQAKFMGPQQGEALTRIYNSCDILMFPSITDTFGLVMLEALASGLPVVAFNTTGPKDVIQPGCGVGFLAQNHTEFAFLATHVWQQRQQGLIPPMRCRQYATQFSWAAVTQTLLTQMAPKVEQSVS